MHGRIPRHTCQKYNCTHTYDIQTQAGLCRASWLYDHNGGVPGVQQAGYVRFLFARGHSYYLCPVLLQRIDGIIRSSLTTATLPPMPNRIIGSSAHVLTHHCNTPTDAQQAMCCRRGSWKRSSMLWKKWSRTWARSMATLRTLCFSLCAQERRSGAPKHPGVGTGDAEKLLSLFSPIAAPIAVGIKSVWLLM